MQILRVEWKHGFAVVERRTNSYLLDDIRFSLFDRVVTYEDPETRYVAYLVSFDALR